MRPWVVRLQVCRQESLASNQPRSARRRIVKGFQRLLSRLVECGVGDLGASYLARMLHSASLLRELNLPLGLV